MSTHLYLQNRLQNAWHSSAHLRKLSPIMALSTAVLMYPQFIQELYHYHIFNLDALVNMIKMAVAWMSGALVWQSPHSLLIHKGDVWSHYGFMILGVIGVVFFFPWQLLGIGAVLLLISMTIYENGFHLRRLAIQGLEYTKWKRNSKFWHDSIRPILQASYLLIGLGAGISLWIAARVGHLL